ncbi:calcium/sodium antiporter [Salinibacter altiplanensis]|uniref:calcium/sodium antiporter n=1 Tax=Salinibacter altiplanensis TaxID=1803181 RepID=UPI000C9F1F9C|nr:calcium/sodium antiporter [Salinibacter altiplanensis]
MAVLLLVAGIMLLVIGAEGLVRGASEIATGLGISPLVVGLTVVALGTSAPEGAVSVGASLGGQPEMALGNVVGSNIFNVLLTLGLTALLTPLAVSARLVRLEVPLGIGAAVGVLLLAMDGTIGQGDGLVLVGGLVAYMILLLYEGCADPEADTNEQPGTEPSRAPRWGRNAGLVLGGLVLLVLGARWIVTGAVDLAQRIGVSELVIGLTIVAGGTSLPELAASVLAGIRGRRELAVGNVLGSNLLNLLAVLGLSALVAPSGVPAPASVLWFDLPVMIATAVACLPIFFTGQVVARWEGALFLGYYGAYMGFLFLAATQHDALPAFSTAMWTFAVPLTVLTLLGTSIREGWSECH